MSLFFCIKINKKMKIFNAGFIILVKIARGTRIIPFQKWLDMMPLNNCKGFSSLNLRELEKQE